MKRYWVLCLCLCSSWTYADGLDAMAKFLKQTRSLQTQFTQTVTAPAKDQRVQRPKVSQGRFAFIRPQWFRFDYQHPYPQVIVADGKSLWLHDIDLNQVTQRQQTQVLATTPAALVASATELATLQKEFDLRAAPSSEGLLWVEAEPRQKDSGLTRVRIGLREEAGAVSLVRLDITDAFGVRSLLQFESSVINPAGLSPADFRFTPPAGVDWIRQ